MTYTIVPYAAKHDAELLALEQRTPQGNKVILEMIKPSFLSRSVVFEQYFIYVALDAGKGKVVGVAGGTIVPIKCEDSLHFAGFGYDLKVAPIHRKKGLAKRFGKQFIDHYKDEGSTSNYLVTLKTGNEAAAKAVYAMPAKWSTFNFSYLTISTSQRVPTVKPNNQDQYLSVELLGKPPGKEDYIIETKSGLGIWKTYKTYQLRILDMPFYVKAAIRIANIFLSKKNQKPKQGDVLKFATLFNYNSHNINSINEALEILQKKNVQYLNVCCTEKDPAYKLLKPYAMNTLPYTVLNNFSVKNGNHVTLDVRCL